GRRVRRRVAPAALPVAGPRCGHAPGAAGRLATGRVGSQRAVRARIAGSRRDAVCAAGARRARPGPRLRRPAADLAGALGGAAAPRAADATSHRNGAGGVAAALARRAKGETGMKIMHVVGARPNFMKIAPIMEAFDRYNRQQEAPLRVEQVLVHTGQHYDRAMSELFFEQL